MSIIFRNFFSQTLHIACIMGLFVSVAAFADTAPASGSDAAIYATNTSLAANLKNLSGKRVTIYLKTGTSLTGTLKSVGDHLVHLEKLDNKDFFDSLILMEQIAAIDTRVRSR